MMFGEGAGVSHDFGLASLRPDDQAPAGAQMTAVDGRQALRRRAHLVQAHVVLELQQYALVVVQQLPDWTADATDLHAPHES